MRGRKPKATALKILENVPPCRINFDEPRFDSSSGLTLVPSCLAGLAREHWAEIVPVLAKGRILTDGDRPNLVLLCKLYERWQTDIKDNQAIEKYIRLSIEFGMTPSSRSRLRAAPEKPRDELAAFLEKKSAT